MLCSNQSGSFWRSAIQFKLLSGVLFFTAILITGFNDKRLPVAGVVTELRLNEGSGTIAADASGFNHPGTLTGGATWTTGRYGQGVTLNGSNGYINIPDHNDFTLSPAQSYTWSAWVKNTNFNQWSTVWSQTVSSTNFFYFYAHTSNDNEAGPVTNGISVYWYNSSSSKLILHSNNNVLVAGQWSYVTVTYNATAAQSSRLTIYVNGTDVTNRSDVVSSGTLASINPTNIRVGANQPYGEYLNGAVDEVRYYTRLLSSAEIISDMNTGNTPDISPPSVAITAPAAGNVSGTINIAANASDNTGVTGVQFQLDGVNLGAEDISSPYTVSWNTLTASNGSHSLTAIARDAAGNSTTSAPVTVNVSNDLVVPTVSITAPSAGVVNGTITLTASASDNVGVAGVQFLLNGANLGSEDVSSPYSISWNTTTVTDASYTLTARARDAAGNTTTSAPLVVTVQNTQPDLINPTVSITAPVTGNVSGTISITASASDNVGVAGVQFLVNGANLGSEDQNSPYTISWNTTTLANGPYTLTAKARDAAGNTATSAGIVVTVNNDVTPPAITLTAPAAGTVSGTINVTAAASDNIAVAGVQFLLDGNSLGSEDVSAPFTVSWATATAGNGVHTLTARARDAAGNTTTSAPVVVTVSNASTNLVAAYSFNESTGTIANDHSGNGNTGTLTNGAAWSASGRFGGAVLFDGSNDLVNVNDANSLDLTNGMTLEAWVRPTNLTGYKTIICKERTTNGYAYTMAANNATSGTSSQRPDARIRIGSSNRTVTGTTKLALNTWTHIAVTYNGSIIRYYVNGVQVSTFSTTGNITTTMNMLRIGGSPNLGSQYFAGLIDEVRIYSRALTQAEIQTDMNTPVAPDVTDPVVSITAPAGGNVSGTINVTASASDNTGVAGVQFLLNGANLGAEDASTPYTVSWNTSSVTNGVYTLSARARDAAGNTAVSPGITVTVNNDVEGPAVSINTPAVSPLVGTVEISAAATDNTGVIGVQFLLDGNNLGAEDLSAPFSVIWNTLAVNNGDHVLTAIARDAAGNTTTSAPLTVTVANPPDTEFPVVAITSPAAGQVSGVVNITASASDNTGIIGVQFLLDGNNLGAEDVTAPFSISWNTGLSGNGPHTLSARARDAAGNIAYATTVNVTVLITDPPVISGISVSAVTPNAVTINWTTDVPASSQVNYGTTTSYGLSTLTDPNLTTSHSMILQGLNPNTAYQYQILSANTGGNQAVSANNNFITASLASSPGSLNGRAVQAYPAGRIIPWTPAAEGYSTVVALAWNYFLNNVPNDPATGKPAYYSRSYLDPNSQTVADWPHNPAGLYSMITESALKYYAYSGDIRVMQIAETLALWHLDNGMTLPTDNWPAVPYSSGDAGSLVYDGANKGNSSGEGDGDGYLEPDKIGELGNAWLQLYKFNGNTRFRDAAIQAADVLTSKIRVGTVNQSPWPFRVNARTGAVREQYTSHLIGPVSLLDNLISMGLGNVSAYLSARTTAWNWLMTYPMQNNVWTQYFEDVGLQGNYASNLNQLNPMMTARYLLEHPEFDPNWEAHVRSLITWVEGALGEVSYGANTMREQNIWPYAMGSHTSRYASVNALLYEKTGDLTAKEKAYRSFNWATYMCRANGVVIPGPIDNNQWFTDGYGDYIRHFMTGMGAVPEWSPAGQTHLLRSTSVIKNIIYNTSSVTYTTYEASSTEVLHINFNPVSVTADGVPLLQRTDLNQQGWVLDIATKTLKIYHTNATEIVISDGTGGRKMLSQELYTFSDQGSKMADPAISRSGHAATAAHSGNGSQGDSDFSVQAMFISLQTERSKKD